MDHAVAGGRSLTRHGTAHTAFPCPRQNQGASPPVAFCPCIAPVRFLRRVSGAYGPFVRIPASFRRPAACFLLLSVYGGALYEPSHFCANRFKSR